MTTITEERKQYLAKYRKEKIKRIPLDVDPSFFSIIKQTAEMRGETVNGFIRTAIQHELMKPVKSPVSRS